MTNQLNIWRKKITSIPRHKMLSCKVHITRAATGWRWRVMRDTTQMDTGIEPTQNKASAAASVAKKRVREESLQLALTV